jgi:malonate transporter MadM subunit
MMDLVSSVFTRNSLIVAFAVIGLTIWLSYWLADKLTAGRIHGSAIAIALGLVAAYWGGTVTGGAKGVADLSLLGGIGLMGGGMLRDFAIVSTAFGVQLSELKKAGLAGVVSIFAGVIVSFIVGAAVAVAFGYTDPIAITTIGAGAVTYIVGPVTGEAIGASGDVVTLSVAAGTREVYSRDDRHTARRPLDRAEQSAVRPWCSAGSWAPQAVWRRGWRPRTRNSCPTVQ